MKTAPTHKVIYDTDHDCGLLSYADSLEDGEMMGENWKGEMDCIEPPEDGDLYNSQYCYEVCELTEEERKEIAKNSFRSMANRELTDSVERIWNDHLKDHCGAHEFTEVEVKELFASVASGYMDGFDEFMEELKESSK
jgi:hypothetical protein